ncbi:hypothetical protein, partial [Turicimonas muris]|uniref:hypothetical protein n=1 Tax=Turicimonas muris TaxID=1796652 RepID=UPI00248BF55F
LFSDSNYENKGVSVSNSGGDTEGTRQHSILKELGRFSCLILPVCCLSTRAETVVSIQAGCFMFLSVCS